MSMILFCKMESFQDGKGMGHEVKGMKYRLADNASEALQKGIDLVVEYVTESVTPPASQYDAGLLSVRKEIEKVMSHANDCLSDVKFTFHAEDFLLQYIEQEEHYELYNFTMNKAFYIKFF